MIKETARTPDTSVAVAEGLEEKPLKSPTAMAPADEKPVSVTTILLKPATLVG